MNLTRPISLDQRASGLLLHPTSLPSAHGIGDLGQPAFDFIDFLEKSGQSWWQMFPLGPLSLGNSPYQTLSVFANNPLLINLDLLVEDGFLVKQDITLPESLSSQHVDYWEVTKFKMPLFRTAFSRFQSGASVHEKKKFKEFKKENKYWLENYSLYSAIKESYNGAPWWEWDQGDRMRKPNAIKAQKEKLKNEILFAEFLQYLFDKQWKALQFYARKRKVGLIGDAPIFVAHDSADVWGNPHLFQLDAEGNPSFVAGVPPDYFSKTGQLWGNPLYRWDVMKKENYKWWIARLKRALQLFDVARLDHFIGFHRYWAVKGSEITAENGSWKKGPGPHFFQKVLKALPNPQIIAEDLGIVTKEVEQLRDQFDIPGMRVLHFAFETHPGAEVNRPYNFRKRSVIYTGTHDNNTTIGWFNNLSDHVNGNGVSEKKFFLKYLNSDGDEVHWDLIRLALSSNSNTSIFPLQDVFGLGEEARINIPGSLSGNWEWRAAQDLFTDEAAKRLHDLSKVYDRLPK